MPGRAAWLYLLLSRRIRHLLKTSWKSSLFLFKFSFLFYPCILVPWPAHKIRGACRCLHSGGYLNWGEVNSAPCSHLPWSKLVSNWGAMPRPSAFRLCRSLVETAQKGQRDAGGLWGLLRHRTTGYHQKEGPNSEHSPFPLRWLLAVGSEGSGDSLQCLCSRYPFFCTPHLSWSGTSELNERGFFIIGPILFSYGFKKFIINHFFLSTFPKA